MESGSILTDPRIVAALVAAVVAIFVHIVSRLYLDPKLESKKAQLSAESAEHDARLKYELEARTRLYRQTGDLRFQLLLAARDLANHFANYGRGERQFSVSIDNYYGQSTVYKFLKPIALCKLIESRIAVADFSVDSDAIELLRFKKAIYKAFSSGEPLVDHPQMNWEMEEQHIFFHSIDRMAETLIVPSEGTGRHLMPFQEFQSALSDPGFVQRLEPLVGILQDFSPSGKPIFWVRVVLYGYLCAEFVRSQGSDIGFELIDFPVETFILGSEDAVFSTEVQRLMSRFEATRNAGL